MKEAEPATVTCGVIRNVIVKPKVLSLMPWLVTAPVAPNPTPRAAISAAISVKSPSYKNADSGRGVCLSYYFNFG